jgi:proteasome alpha subunit
MTAAALEVAVLDRGRPGRAFRRLTGAALTTLVPAVFEKDSAAKDSAAKASTAKDTAAKDSTAAAKPATDKPAPDQPAAEA